SENLESSPPSSRPSPPSAHASACCVKSGATRGWRAHAPFPGTSAGKNAPWPFNQASVIAGIPAQFPGSWDSAVSQSFGTQPADISIIREQSSYFSTSIALLEKIISSGAEGSTRSTDHVDNNKHPEVSPSLARHLGGYRCGHLHRP